MIHSYKVGVVCSPLPRCERGDFITTRFKQTSQDHLHSARGDRNFIWPSLGFLPPPGVSWAPRDFCDPWEIYVCPSLFGYRSLCPSGHHVISSFLLIALFAMGKLPPWIFAPWESTRISTGCLIAPATWRWQAVTPSLGSFCACREGGSGRKVGAASQRASTLVNSSP